MAADAPAESLQVAPELEAEFVEALQYDLTDEDLERAKLLYEKGAFSLNDYQTAEDVENKAQVDVETAAERLRVLGSPLDHPSGIVDVYAPVSGVITDQQVDHIVESLGAVLRDPSPGRVPHGIDV